MRLPRVLIIVFFFTGILIGDQTSVRAQCCLSGLFSGCGCFKTAVPAYAVSVSNPAATGTISSSGTTVTVDDASIFPETPYYGQKLEYVDSNGKRRTSDYTRRSGLQNGTVNVANQFTGVSATGFVSNIVVGSVLFVKYVSVDSRGYFITP